MTRHSPFDYDISVTADKQRRARRRAMTGEVGGAARACDQPGCEAAGLYRAPRAPDELDRFYWFCLEHVRDYNRSWNFFQNLSESELERQLEADRLWGRRTRPFRDAPGAVGPDATHGEGAAWRRMGFDDPFEVLGEKATPGGDPQARPEARAERRLPATERRALEILGAQAEMSRTEIRSLYTRLVKQLHPDMNGGHRGDEARLQEVLWAWEQIKGSRSFAD